MIIKHFGEQVNLFHTEKVKFTQKLLQLKKKEVKKKDKEEVIIEEVISNDSNISKTINELLANIVSNLKITRNENFEAAKIQHKIYQISSKIILA